jgi:hypothetical protein
LETQKWQTQKVFGRDEVLQNIEKHANAYRNSVVQDVRAVMHDYEVDMYRLVLSIGKHYGMEKAYEIMSETVSDKRLRWLDQVKDELELTGTEVAKGFALYHRYFGLIEENFHILEVTNERIVFKRKDYIDAIAHACDVLDLDVIDVNNKVYSRSMNLMFEKINLAVKHVVLKFRDGWYDEMIELSKKISVDNN